MDTPERPDQQLGHVGSDRRDELRLALANLGLHYGAVSSHLSKLALDLRGFSGDQLAASCLDAASLLDKIGPADRDAVALLRDIASISMTP